MNRLCSTRQALRGSVGRQLQSAPLKARKASDNCTGRTSAPRDGRVTCNDYRERRAITVSSTGSTRNAHAVHYDRNAPLPSDAQRRTIYAIATPNGKGGIAVVRISGPDALGVYQRMVRPHTRRNKGKEKAVGLDTTTLEPRRMERCWVVDPYTEEQIDDGLVVYFKAPHSFTTEDVLELHVHSGRAILAAILRALAQLATPGDESSAPPLLLRPAERGEFTRRAFDGGRLDLTQVEALRDLVDAETEVQRRVAIRGAQGSTRAKLEAIRSEIISAMAMVEALIDFGEGEDIEEGVYCAARERVSRVRDLIAGYLNDSRRGEILRSGVKLAIFGPPNAGKSSLLNFLAQREAAIVTSVPGTTRDVLELTLDIGGLAVVIADTAGLRKTDDVIEKIGIERARQRVQNSDVSLCVLSHPDVKGSNTRPNIPDAIRELLAPSTFVLLNKTDLVSSADVVHAKHLLPESAGVWAVSLTAGIGTEDFLREFGATLNKKFAFSDEEEAPLITTTRQRIHLEDAHRLLATFLDTDDVVIAAEELRYAADAVGKVTGAIGIEEVLDTLFQQFCIGK